MQAAPRSKCKITGTVQGVVTQLLAHVISRPVILGGELSLADQESDIVQMGALDLFEYVNVGKDQARSNWTAGTVPEAVLEDHERLIEFGGSKAWLSPCGLYYSAPHQVTVSGIRDRVPQELIAALNKSRSKSGASCYDFVFTLPVAMAALRGMSVTFAHQKDNAILVGFKTRLKVLHDQTQLFAQEELRVKDGRCRLSPIPVAELFQAAGAPCAQFLRLDVFDADPMKAGQTQATQYGSLHLRQASHPCSIYLAPEQGGILDVPGGLKSNNLTLVSYLLLAQGRVDLLTHSRSGCLPAGRLVRLDFLVLDQHGVPVEVSEKLRRHFEAEAEAVVVSQAAGPASQPGSAAGEHACDPLSDWVWRGADGARGVLHSSVTARLPLHLVEGRAQLILRVEIPACLDPAHIPAQVEVLQLSVPICVRSFRGRVAAGAGGLECHAAWETRVGAVAAGARGARARRPAEVAAVAGADGHLAVSLGCVEGSLVEVEVSLLDAQACGAQDTEFVVDSSTLPQLTSHGLATGCKVKSVGSKLLLQLQVGIGGMWCKTHTLTLRPAEAGYEGVLRIKLTIAVQPSSRITHAVSLCQWPAGMLVAAAAGGGGNPPPGSGGSPPAGPGEGAVPRLVMALSNAHAVPGHLPPVKARLATANGEVLDAAQLKPMQLLLQIQGDRSWVTIGTPVELKPQRDMVYATEADTVHVPERAGTFQIVLHYPDLPALVVAHLTTRAAPAVSLSFPPSYHVPPDLRDPTTCNSLATAAAHSKAFPQVEIQMVDRWRNAATCAFPVQLHFVTQEAASAGSPTASDATLDPPAGLIPAGAGLRGIPSRCWGRGLAGFRELQSLPQRAKGIPVMDITDPVMHHRFRLQGAEEDTQHPQRPLRFLRTRAKLGGVLEMDATFQVSSGDESTPCPPLGQHHVSLEGSVRGEGQAGASRGTYAGGRRSGTTWRPTQWQETKAHLNELLARCKAAGITVSERIICLDGATHNMMDAGMWVDVEEGKQQFLGDFILAAVPAPDQEAACWTSQWSTAPCSVFAIVAAEIDRKRAAAESMSDTSNALVTAGMALRDAQRQHEGHEQHCAKAVADTTAALAALQAQLKSEKERLAKLLARKPPVEQQQSRAQLAAAKRRGSAAAAAAAANGAGPSNAAPQPQPQHSSSGPSNTPSGATHEAPELESRRRSTARR
ncbi:MAG: hypothetical protein WDW38_009254 [Sanguina aurantia]